MVIRRGAGIAYFGTWMCEIALHTPSTQDVYDSAKQAKICVVYIKHWLVWVPVQQAVVPGWLDDRRAEPG